jgi:hypothetical protein
MEWPLLADLPPEDVRELLAIARRRTFSRGEVVSIARISPTRSTSWSADGSARGC